MQDTFTTPMMRQYNDIKKQYTDCLLFYRMGDFYELFLEDAHIGAKILNITLTGKANGKGGRIPMAGVPYHAVDFYLSKLVTAGYKVAICEQLSPPNKKGLVKRDVVRIVTPGTLLDEKTLEKRDHNYLISLTTSQKKVAFSVTDISTGYFATTEVETETKDQTIIDELSKIHPKECILPDALYNDPEFLQLLKSEKDMNIYPFPDWDVYAKDAQSFLQEHFGVTTLQGFGLDTMILSQETCASLLGYLKHTQKGPVEHIKKIEIYSTHNYLLLDRSTVLNLELFTTIREHDKKGTLLSVIDHTVSAMGARMLKEWMRKPLIAKESIVDRLTAVEELQIKQSHSVAIYDLLTKVSDIERLISRCSVGLGNARDLVNLKNSLITVLSIKKVLDEYDSSLLRTMSQMITQSPINGSVTKSINNKDSVPESKSIDSIDKIIRYIEETIKPEPPISLKEGGMIHAGIDKELDRLRKIVAGSRDWIIDLEQKERERTGINSLKIRFNQVFGFYIEISKSNLDLVPSGYTRKQTLVSAERFITEELKKQEEIILTAEEKIHEIEYQIFQSILKKILENILLLQRAAESIATIDCLLNFSLIAQKNNYVKPTISESGELIITGGRHPVVETLLENTQFVPNDLKLQTNEKQLLLLTGPNMAGKSVFIRQNALIVLLSHMGSFVPAKEAHISLTDKIFVRSGASDVITSGLSTFMVEMVETAHILNHATPKSLIIMDEIGRGTSTYDGISIAWAVAEYLVTNGVQKPKTLFATHYHELVELEKQYPLNICNYHMAVSSDKGDPVFLHTILPGGASHSYGVAVAKLAGIPESVIHRANEILEELENRAGDVKLVRLQPTASAAPQTEKRLYQQINLADHLIHKELEAIDIARMTPLDALNVLADLKDKLVLLTKEHKNFLEAD